jgi:hypothetical protein
MWVSLFMVSKIPNSVRDRVIRTPHADRALDIPLHNDSSSGWSRNGEHEVLDFDDTDISFAANLYGGSRVELILEIRSTCHDLGPSLTDDSRADRDV